MADELETLKAEARERWGDDWTIEQLHFADWSTSAHAFHTIGHFNEGAPRLGLNRGYF